MFDDLSTMSTLAKMIFEALKCQSPMGGRRASRSANNCQLAIGVDDMCFLILKRGSRGRRGAYFSRMQVPRLSWAGLSAAKCLAILQATDFAKSKTPLCQPHGASLTVVGAATTKVGAQHKRLS